MLILTGTLFCLACLVTGGLAFPVLGDRLRRRGLGAVGQAGGWLGQLAAAGAGARAWRALGAWKRRAWTHLRAHGWRAGGAAVLVALPPLAVLLLGRGGTDAFDLPEAPANPQIAELLKGERLQPPAPLPPMVFATPDVAAARPLLAQASRNWTRLDPAFTQKLLRVFRIMRERHGYDMALLEGYRSPERQQILASMGPQVTNAGAYQSYHQYGLAADCAFVRDGRLVISEKDAWAMRGYQLYGAAAEEVGLRWGGRWTLRDYGHAELRAPGARREAEAVTQEKLSMVN